ncbi:MAG: hypothetical protein WCT26_01690 [Candidatus Buchananbacteria bacterium]|jgi:hypothetical protein
MKNVLLVHGLTTAIEELFEGISDWRVKSVEHDELVKELKTGKYEALFIDMLCPNGFFGEGLFPDIGEHESYNGSLTAFLLALRLREVYPDLPIVIIGDAGIPGGMRGRTLLVKCTDQDICYAEFGSLKHYPVQYVDSFIRLRAMAKKIVEDDGQE